MRIKSLALATTLSLLASSALVGHASAQKGMTLQPQTDWAVKKINEDTPDAYCALARRFKQSMILTFAKNKNNESSLAIDFSRDEFDVSRSYKIVLDPGAGQQRQYQFKPASSKAFVIRIGQDEAFLRSLDKTGYLRVEVDGENYNFNLADIDSGQARLEACLASTVLPAAGEDVIPTITPTPALKQVSSPELSTLKAEKSRLEQKLFALEKENEQLRIQKATELKPIDLTPSNTSNPSTLQMERELKNLKAENAALESKLELAQSGVVNTTDVSVIELARENQRLQEKLASADTSEEHVKQIRELTEKISKLENENLSLAKKASLEKERDLAYLKENIVALKNENIDLRSNLESNTGNTEKYQALQNKVEALEFEKDRLDRKISQLQGQKDQFANKIDFFEVENASLREKLAENSSVDNDLLIGLRDGIRSMEKNNAQQLALKEEEISTLENKIATLKTENARLGASSASDIRAAAQEFEAEISSLRVKNEALQEELVSLSQENDEILKLKNAVSSLTQEKASLSDSLDQAYAEIASLETETKTSQNAKSEISSLNDEIKQLDKKILSLETENFELENKLGNLEKQYEKDIAKQVQAFALESEIDQLKEANNNLQLKLDELVIEQDSAQVSFDAVKLENEKLKEELLNQDISGEEKITELRDLNSDLEKELALLAEKELEQSKELASLNKTIQSLEKQNELLQNSIDKAGEQKNLEISSLQEENQSLKEAAFGVQEEKEKAIAALEDKLKELETTKSKEIASLEESLLILRENVQSTEDSFSEELEILQKANADLKQENSDLKIALQTADEVNQQLQADWLEALKTIEELRLENAKYEMLLAENSSSEPSEDITEKIAELQEQNDRLTSQLESQTREYLAVVRELEVYKSTGLVAAGTQNKAAMEEVASLRKSNTILEQEVEKLQDLLRKQQRPEMREASYTAPVPVKKPVKQARTDDNDAPYTSQEEQARRNVETMRMAARNVDDADAPDASVVADIEPAAGDGSDNISGEDVSSNANQVVEENAVPYAEQLDGIPLNEAQRLEKRMMGQMNTAPAVVEPVENQPIENDVVNAEAASPTIEEDVELAKPIPEVESESIALEKSLSEDLSRNSSKRPDSDAKPLEQKPVYNSGVDIAGLLGDAGIRLKNNVQTVDSHSGDNRIAYQWTSSNDLFGSAQQRPISSSAEFDNYVRDYLSNTEERCTGDFAIVPALSTGSGQTRVDSYEIACVGAGVDSAASVVFFSKNGTFTVLAHEAPTEGMEMAMEARDRIVSSVTKS